jgi:hypothetical protein
MTLMKAWVVWLHRGDEQGKKMGVPPDVGVNG